MGAGTIEERPGGRYRARLRNDGKRVELGTYASRAEAEAVIAGAVRRLDETASSPTLADWIERWLVQRELSGAVRSAYDDRSRLRAHVLEHELAQVPLEAITRKQVRAWAHGLLLRRVRRHDGRGGLREGETTLSRHTVAHVYATLRVCLRDAVEAGLLEENPATGVRLPRAQYTREPWTYLDAVEIAQLLGCPEIPEPYRLLYAVAIYTGCRKGELWGLRWGDVYLEHATPHVMVRRSRKHAPKNGKIRMVPLLAPAREALERLREITRGGGSTISTDQLVFPASDGSMRTRWNDARWKPRRVPYLLADGTRKHRSDPGYRQLAGIARKVRFHDLRHTCASHLLMGTWGRAWRLEEVRDLLGHSDVTVTQRYAHLAPDRLHAAAAATADFGGPTAAPGSPSGAPAGDRQATGIAADSSGAICESRTRDLRFTKPGETPTVSLAYDPVGAVPGPAQPQLEELAREVLRAASAGDASAAFEQLAAAVLDLLEQQHLPRAARAVLEASERYRCSRGVELAELVLEQLGAGAPHRERAR